MGGIGHSVHDREVDMIAIQTERVSRCWDEIDALAKLHWSGTQSYRRHEPYNPDTQRYFIHNHNGFFHLITARDDGKLIGYFGVYITPSMHSQLLTAVEDTFFIHPGYRQGRLALRILRFVEHYLAELGVREILFSCEIDNTSGIQGLLNLLDYEPVIMQYRKRLPQSGTDSAAAPATTGGDHVRSLSSSCS